MTRRFLASLALAGLLALSFTPAADAGSIMMCKPPAPGQGSAGPGQVTMLGSSTTYSLDRWGCAAFSITDVGEATANGFAQTGALRALILSGATAAATVGVLPPSAYLVGVLVQNQSATSVTNGLKFGTTASGTDIITGMLAATGNTLTAATDASIAKRAFNMTQAQSIFVDAVTSWNSAKVNITVLYTFF